MKKLIYLVALFLGFASFAQGPLHIYNYSSYDLVGRLYANGTSPGNCLPEVFTSYNVPAGALVDIKSFNLSNMATVPINNWSVRTTSTVGATNVPVPSGLLITLGNITRWHFYWFQTRYAGTINSTPDPDFPMGENMCGWSNFTDYVYGVLTQAKWYYDPVTNETTLIVEDI
ncbi:hypothetical protein ACM39_02535 [Chryseobacterium sp. FH2]|uniref:hypothetical protein n=1 Tax=Chryseobacterium sp. FH2 TaxID=1674291 RepID=UPI00065AA9F4|nr:hypothetical protein [Chryseobacterium sp. FH2]KMQ69935.1 hypothetical protein ACM39_02535 [Chryseobacterium sp. FH2]